MTVNNKAKYKLWTTEETKYVTANWGRIKPSKMAKTLGRTTSSIHRKAHYLGLKMNKEEYEKITGKTRWTPQMDKYLQNSYGKVPIEEIAEHLEMDNLNAIRKRASDKGYSEDYHKWTYEEELYLEERWGEVSIKHMANKLGLSYEAVRLKAYQMGLKDQLNWSGDYLSIPMVEEITGIPRETLYSYNKIGLIKCKRLAIGKIYRYQIHYKDLINFLKENQNKYDTRYCDIDTIKSLLSSYRITSKEKLKINDLPDWWIQKVESDKHKPEKYIPKNWVMSEDKKLTQLVREGYTYREIADILERTLYSIEGRVRLLKRKGLIK